MAIIPRATDQVLMSVSSPVPIRGSANAGVAEAAQADVGGAISKLGVTVMQHYQRQQEMAQANSYEISASKLEGAYQTSVQEATRQAAPDGSDLQQKFTEISQPLIDEIKANGPTDQNYIDRLNAHDESFRAKVIAPHLMLTHGSMLEKYNADGANKIADTFSDSVRQNPVPGMLASRVSNYGTYLDGLTKNNTISEKTATKLKDDFQEKVGLSFIEGLAQTGRHSSAINYLTANQADPSFVSKLDPEQAQQAGLIDGREAQALKAQGKTYDLPVITKSDGVALTPEVTQALNAIDPIKKAGLIDHLKAKADMENNLKIGELNSQVSGLEYLAYHGGPITDAQTAQVKSQINQNASLTPFARVRLMDQVNTAVASNQMIQQLSSLPRNKWSTVIDTFDTRVQNANTKATGFDSKMASAGADLAVQSNRLQAKNRIESYAQTLAKSQSDDAAGFVIGSDQNTNDLYRGTKDNDPSSSQTYARQMLSKQAFLQIPPEDRSILPNGDAQAMGTILKNMPNAEAANDFLTKQQAKWGPYYPKVLGEIAGTDKALQKYATATYAPAETRGDLVDAIQNAGPINDNFKNIEKTGAIKEHDVVTQVNAKLQGFTQAIGGSSNDTSRIGIVNNFRDAMTNLVKRDAVRGGVNFSNLSGSVDSAFEQVIGSQYSIIPSKNSSVLAPKQIGGAPINASSISDYISNMSSADSLKTLGLQVPNDPLGKYQRDPDSFYKDLATTGRWVTNQAQDGMKLMNVEMDGKLSPIYDAYGKPVEKKYLDIMNNPPPVKNSFLKSGGKL